MAFSRLIEEQLQKDPTGLASLFAEMNSVPAFIYNFMEDRYLAVSKALGNLLPAEISGKGMYEWINRIHPEDFQTFYDAYMHDMDRLAQLRKGDPLFTMKVIPLRVANVNLEWIPTIIKADVVGYDAQGRANCIFGLLLTDESLGKADENLLGKNDWQALQQKREKHFGKENKTVASPIAITVREWEVLNHLQHGLSTRQISAHLKISMHTVESHRKKLMQKFDSHTSAELVAKAAAYFKFRDHP